MKSVALFACLALSACAAIPREHSMPQSPSTSWRQVATSNDRTRLRDWRAAFNRALVEESKRVQAAGGQPRDVVTALIASGKHAPFLKDHTLTGLEYGTSHARPIEEFA